MQYVIYINQKRRLLRLSSFFMGGFTLNGITELALLFKDRENGAAYSPMFGRITALPALEIKLSDKVTLSALHIKRICEINQQDEHGQYINLNREAVLLPYADGQKFILLGVVL